MGRWRTELLHCLICLEEELLLSSLLVDRELFDRGFAVRADWDAEPADKRDELFRDLHLAERVLKHLSVWTVPSSKTPVDAAV